MKNFERTSRKLITLMLILSLLALIPYYPSENLKAYAVENTGKKVLSTEVYYHLDMGVQLVYYDGATWENGYKFGSSTRSNINTSIYFNEEILVKDVYPLESSKGSQRYNFSGSTSSNNIPEGLGAGREAYDNYYKDYASNLINVDSYVGVGNRAGFNYSAFLGTFKPLEVMEYGELGRGGYIYSLFGGATRLQATQPEIYESIRQALNQAANGTAGKSKLYLVFCPNVIEYQKYLEYGDLTADLDLPVSVKQGETYTVKDASLIDDNLIVEKAVLEKSGATQLGLSGTGLSGTLPGWQVVATWVGSLPGENTGGFVNEQATEIGTVKYRLTITADNGQVDEVIKTIQVIDGRDIRGTAKLKLQPVTYEGHPAWAIDESTFIVDGQNYSGARAYEENVAENSFIPQSGSGGKISRKNLTEATVTFPARGIYKVALEVNLANNSTLEDTKSIEVKKTPSILDSLGGIQKQNRKQVLTAAVATYPGKPVTDYYIEVTDRETGEKITLTKEEPQKNNAAIKTRELVILGGTNQQDPNKNDSCWTTFTVEFLTKTPNYVPGLGDQSREFKYKIWVQDSKGDTDMVEKIFKVAPDLPPEPRIQIQDTFIREKGTNTAKIEVVDGTTTDGDQLERTWTTEGAPIEAMAGFKDLSFHSKQHIQFEKSGVGQLEIKLKVKEKWIEPTLEEYVTEEDYKSGESVAVTEVINIPPTVSVKPINGKEANVTIVATPNQSQLLQDQINNMKARFLEKGIASQINIIKRAPSDDGGYRQVYYKTWNSAMWCPSTCREIGPIYDSNYVYTIRSNSIVNQNYSQVCNGTHTIYADSVDNTLPGWNYTVNQSASFYIKLDNKEKYVYVIFRDLGSTVLLNRENGAEVARIPLSFDGEIFLNQDNEIFVANSSQIAKVNPDTLTLEKVSPGGGLIRLLEGKIAFIGTDPSSKLGNRFYLGQYDMNQECLKGKALPEIPINGINWTAGGKSGITPVDMDSSGKVVFTQTYNNSSYGTGQNASIWVADSNTQEVKCVPFAAPIGSAVYYLRGLSAGFVKDSTGEGRYLYLSYYEDENRYAATVRWYFKLYDMKIGTQLPITEVMSTGRQPNTYNFAGISYAKIHEAENKIYILRGNSFQGGDWGGIQTGERMTIKLPNVNSPTFSRGETVAQWDAADEYSTDNGFLSATYYFYEKWIDPENRVKIFKNTITDSQAIEQAIKKCIPDREEENTYILKDLIPLKENIAAAIDDICLQVEEKLKTKKGIELATGKGIGRKVQLKGGSQYAFEYDVFTSPGAVSSVVYPFEYPGENQSRSAVSHYKELAAQLDFTNPDSVASNNFYTYSATCYLEGRGGYGSGYYGKKGQSSSYNFVINQRMKKEGYTEFDMFNYLGYQVTGGWSIFVDGKLYDTRSGLMEEHKTIFLEAGEHRIVFSGFITNGYYGYIGVSNIETVYYGYSDENILKEKFSIGSFWNNGSGSFKPSLEPLFNMTEELKTDILRETFSENKVNITQYLRFTNNATCPWGFNSNGGYASMGSSYQTSAVGSFGIVAPADKHLVVSYNEAVSIERTPTTTTVTGNSKMIGANTFFVAAGQSFYRNYDLQRGRSGGYGSVKVDNIRVIEIPATISGDAFFGENGAANINISTRTTPFYAVKFISPESTSYIWKTFSGLDVVGPAENGAISLVPQGMTDEASSLIRNFRLYQIIGNAKLLVLKQPFEDANHVVADKWMSIPTNEKIKITTIENPEKEEPSLVYKKGQLVAYDINYNDYENDPSKRQYWKYYHTQMNDGVHPGATQLGPDGTPVNPDAAGPVFDTPIERFYIDGKYTVEHWQEDNTARATLPLDANGYPQGNPAYDKLSNVEIITFYVEGTSEAPWIKSIETGASQLGPDGTPDGFSTFKVSEGENFAIQIKVDDLEKDVLNLKTEVYKDGKHIYTHYKESIQANGKIYPPVITGSVGLATPGKYQVVCTVRDETGAGLGTYRFTVFSQGKIIGSVGHTDEWEFNRKNYNLKHGVIGDPETPRGKNTFWPGETFILKAEVAGSPSFVKAEILGYFNAYGKPRYKSPMTATGMKNDRGEMVYKGEIWDKTMIKTWSKKGPIPIKFRFTAIYGATQLGPDGTVEPGEGSTVRYHEAQVIVDDRDSYLMLHRVW